MAEHVHDDAAVILLAVVPRWSLCGLPVTFEDPISELATHGKNSAEEATVHQSLQLSHARQKELILHNAVLYTGGLGLCSQSQRHGRIDSEWLLTVNVFSGGDRSLYAGRTQRCQLRVKVERVVRVCERTLQIRGPARNLMFFSDLLQFCGITSHQNRIGKQARTIH